MVLFLEKNTRVDRGEIVDDLLEDRVRRIGIIFETETDRELVLWVVLSKGRSDTVVESGLYSLDGSNNGDVRRILAKLRGQRRSRATLEVVKACVACQGEFG
jgi:hypothetical protein